jgi:hypothetical protein
MVEDKPGVAGAERSFSWWDIQDGNAKLPIKETSQDDLRKLLFPPKAAPSTTDTATKAAKGAFKMMGKAVASAIGDDGGAESSGPPVSVLVVKLLDLVKLHDEYALKHGGAGGHAPTPAPRPRRAPAAPRPPQQQPRQQQQQQQRQAAPANHGHAQQQQPQRRAQSSGVTASAPPRAPANLMDFGDAPAAPAASVSSNGSAGAASFNNPKVLRHAHSNPNETRAQRLKREQEERMKSQNRVWDEIDQRWVEEHPDQQAKSNGTLGAAFGATSSDPPKKKEVGIKLDLSNAAGKSASVQKAISERVNEMEANRQKAVAEVKQREALKKQREEEEDRIRQQLEPKIKAWSEEHGKKKQLTALLGTLHTILWPGAKWTQVSIGDVLDPKKCKKIYFKATLVVHPDKTHDLPADQRFLAKRIFDALTQAKTIYDQNGGR